MTTTKKISKQNNQVSQSTKNKNKKDQKNINKLNRLKKKQLIDKILCLQKNLKNLKNNLEDIKKKVDKKIEKKVEKKVEQSISPKRTILEIENCCICTDITSSKIINPCGHICLCYKCSKKFPTNFKKCPICRTKINSIIDIVGIETDEKIHYKYSLGSIVEANYISKTSKLYWAKITSLNKNGTYNLEYKDGDKSAFVSEDLITQEYKSIKTFSELNNWLSSLGNNNNNNDDEDENLQMALLASLIL